MGTTFAEFDGLSLNLVNLIPPCLLMMTFQERMNRRLRGKPGQVPELVMENIGARLYSNIVWSKMPCERSWPAKPRLQNQR